MVNKKATITGAVTLQKDVIQAPVTNLSNAWREDYRQFLLTGPEPGYDGSTIRARGTNTTGNPNAYRYWRYRKRADLTV
jgi:hypothetical protein